MFESLSMIFLALGGGFVVVWIVKEFTNFVPTLNLREAFYTFMGVFILFSIIKVILSYPF